MPYGRLSRAQREAVSRIVTGKVVWDLGAGDGALGALLRLVGAERVIAIEKSPVCDYFTHCPSVELRQLRFDEVEDESMPLVFLSWPNNHETPGLARIVRNAETVIYLGKNTDGTSCGWPRLFEELAQREVVCHVPQRANTLIVYGARRVERERLPEEQAGIDIYSDIYSYVGP